MSSYCRTCAKLIYCQQAQNLFEQPDNVMLHQIETLTGMFLMHQPAMPTLICGPCVVALREAIAFRERITKTQNLLQNSMSVAETLNQINKVDLTKLEIDEITVNEEALQPETTDDELAELRIQETPVDVDDKQSSVKNNERKLKLLKTSLLKKQHQKKQIVKKPEVKRKSKRASTIYTSLTFGERVNKAPRINWSTLTEDQIVELQRKRARRECICEQCGRHFATTSNLKMHMLRHTGIKNFSCKTCQKKFYTAHLLRRHEMQHINKRPHACQYCGDTFPNYKGRIIHVRTRHTNYMPYKCTECDRSFPISCHLKQHMLSHTGVRNFHCEACDLSFMTKAHRVVHFRSKGHKQNIEKLGMEPTIADHQSISSN